MGRVFQAFSAPAPTTAQMATVALAAGTIKTLLQIQTPATMPITIVEWGISFDGTSAGVPVSVSLLTTAAIAATVTAHVAAGVPPLSDTAEASKMTLGTAGTGYNASAEGTIAASRTLDTQLVSPMGAYLKQWPLGREPRVPASTILRVRATAPAAVNAIAWVAWEEA